MNVESSVIAEEGSVARAKYREYRSALKVHKQEYIAALASIYWQLARGRKVIDVAKAITDAGPNEKGEPKLAIARADQSAGHFDRMNSRLYFRLAPGQKSKQSRLVFEVPNWPANIGWKSGSAPIPLIPPEHLPLGAKNNPIDLANYHILWEVEKWAPVPSPDPMLLRHLDGALYVIVAAWNLTPAEQAVMRQALRV